MPGHEQPDHCATKQWKLVEEKQFFLHNPPNSFTGLYRTQGMATDGRRWFFSWQYGLEIADRKFNSLQRNSSFQLPANLTPGIPANLLAQGLNHIGDIDYADGVIYASLDTTSGYTNGHVALFNAHDLSYTGIVYELTGAPSNPKKDIASWVAVDARHQRGYGKEWQSGNTVNVYSLRDWKFIGTITMDMALESIQGAKVHGDWLYMSSDNKTQSVYRANLHTGHVEELFRLPTPVGDREVEGIALQEGPDGDLNIYVEMIVDPDRSGQDLANTNLHVSLFHYREEGRSFEVGENR
ncbi:hypothetical protein BRAS3843_760010 [Bradyrhizobium sp. STM 3843]|nr:hypothetical protein BRAS3843_760010 [Bradyrhizobium sp. STM 3843]